MFLSIWNITQDAVDPKQCIGKHGEVASMQAAVVYVGDRLKNLRTLNALTQAELAERAGLTTAAVARVERDEAEPRPSTLRKLAKALNVQPRDLIEE
jgi:ribosome-binding protein aMBF1 (putative translation factor)